MGKKEYYGSAQFQPLLPQRDYDDKMFSDMIRINAEYDVDIADSMVTDILQGNTATIRKAYKNQRRGGHFVPGLINGSVDPEGRVPNYGPIYNHTLYGIYPIKDDYSNSKGVASYADLPDDDERKKDVAKILDHMNMDWEDVASKIVAPEDIPPLGSDEWNKEYGNAFKDSDYLQSEYHTEAAWREQLVDDLEEQRKAIPDITDIHIGFYATGTSLNSANVNALYYTCLNLYPQITPSGYDRPTYDDAYFPGSYMMTYFSGDFAAIITFQEWSHIIRVGRVKNQYDHDPANPKYRNKKSGWNIYDNKNTARRNHTTGDPIYRIDRANPLDGWVNPPEDTGYTCLELHVQLKPLPDGTQIYGEIRIWDYGTMHVNKARDGKITVIGGTLSGSFHSSGSHGLTITTPSDVYVADQTNEGFQITTNLDGSPGIKYGIENTKGDYAFYSVDATGLVTFNFQYNYAERNAYYIRVIAYTGNESNATALGTKIITIHVENTYNKPHPPYYRDPYLEEREAGEPEGRDLVWFPLEYKEGAHKVAFWERERFMRESIMLGIYSVKVVKVKWYQRGWFKVVIFIVAVIIAVVTGPAGWAGLLSFNTVVMAAAQIVLIQIVGLIIQKIFVDNPLIGALVMFAVAVLTQNIELSLNLDSMMSLATVALDASNTYLQMEMMKVMKELEKSIDKMKKEFAAAEKELEQLAEEAGGLIRPDDDVTLMLATRPYTEGTDTYMERTTDVSNAIITDVDSKVDVYGYMPSQLKE